MLSPSMKIDGPIEATAYMEDANELSGSPSMRIDGPIEAGRGRGRSAGAHTVSVDEDRRPH